LSYDLGQQAVKQLIDLWQIDKHRMVRTENGFDWWPGQNKISVQVQEGETAEFAGTWRIRIVTDFVKEVDLTLDANTQALSNFARFSPSYGLSYTPTGLDPDLGITSDSRVFLSTTGYLREDMISWMPKFLSGMAILQAIDTSLAAIKTSRILHGVSDTSGPNSIQADDNHDEMLDLGSTFFVPKGKERNLFDGLDEYEQFAANYGRSANCYGNGDSTGLTFETPLGEQSILIRLSSTPEHPALGKGLQVTMQLPLEQTEAETIQHCSWLNFLESMAWTNAPQLGSWHAQPARVGLSDPDTRQGHYQIAYGCFVPNALFSHGIVTNLALWQLGRASWVKSVLFPDLKDLTMPEILNRRFGIKDSSV